ncbi:MAG: transcriptional repressor LexA [Pelistega sp.]|nr:transcriptional repressor LexA [Pelistega sp.]
MIKLTARQQEILDFIRQSIFKTGFPPTRAEIAKALGFRSPNAAEDHLKALVKKGAISVLPGTSRGIRLNPEFSSTQLESPASQNAQTVSSTQQNLTPGHDASTSSTTVALLSKTAQALRGGIEQITEALSLPVVGRVAAGNPILAEENLDKTLHVDPALFSSTPDYLLKVKGESMRDVGILDGDLIAVKRQAEARNGQIIVARIDEEVTVKRFQRTKTHIELLPENSDFEPIIVTGDREFSIEGIAVGLIRQQQFH